MKASALLSLGLALLAASTAAQEVIIDNLDPQFTSQLAPGSEGGVVVLMYHGLDGSFGYDPADFQAQMQYLADNGYATWTMDQLLGWIETGTPEPVSPTVVLTFDDNYLTVYSVAYPTLQSHGFVGINFTHTAYVGVVTSYDHCDWIEISAMESAGVLFTESHSRTHPDLTTLSDSSLNTELAGSRSAIETNIPGKTCRHLAYPYGAYDGRVITFAETAGYETAVTTVPGVVTRSTPLMEIGRYGVNPDTPMSTFISTVSNASGGGGVEWTSSTSEPEHWSSDYQYAPGGTAGAVATWVFTPSQSGEWAIDVWYTDHSNRATNAPYAVNHADGTTVYRVDQTSGGGAWNTLGSHMFHQGNYYSVQLTADDADGFVIADAIRLRWVSSVPAGLVILGAE
ncbi:polysaccharide deacetylase family protein [Candidatus Sumerlaeota bacterium]|nr:polysaccharide deacetylase family protein [Candidatus Sumerlaeota bacterium]